MTVRGASCRRCGSAFTQDKGTTRHYCTAECKRAADHDRWQAKNERRTPEQIARYTERARWRHPERMAKAAERRALQSAARAERYAPRPCEGCGSLFAPNAPAQRFCGMRCSNNDPAKVKAKLAAARVAFTRVIGEGPHCCPHCGVRFSGGPRNVRFCSPECNARFHHRRDPWEAKRRRARSVLRAAKAALITRDGMVCGICRGAIPEDVDPQHPRALTLDHIMPVSAGGTDDLANLQLAHRECNVAKGDDLPAWWERASHRGWMQGAPPTDHRTRLPSGWRGIWDSPEVVA